MVQIDQPCPFCSHPHYITTLYLYYITLYTQIVGEWKFYLSEKNSRNEVSSLAEEQSSHISCSHLTPDDPRTMVDENISIDSPHFDKKKTITVNLSDPDKATVDGQDGTHLMFFIYLPEHCVVFVSQRLFFSLSLSLLLHFFSHLHKHGYFCNTYTYLIYRILVYGL